MSVIPVSFFLLFTGRRTFTLLPTRSINAVDSKNSRIATTQSVGWLSNSPALTAMTPRFSGKVWRRQQE